ncbi:ABC transporter ATP-binding protein [Shouchella lehensis]|uniref:ABC transporter ATP-binding protein n=1 Tax=Shouchella lehensis TaxID=300825 RepID=A0A4Y7WI61_9BACI|nr:ABC transporter ATP-binding protein [Shouchella lehensis]MBG9782582.1 peptide ABC transporter ATP-binding protein [Shouchella lehensis]RQW21963.1 ABC transporter ATP-binding protein [Bacillus sp. C1-1]TES47805.1 ABC transporter ATP-binding protein [Shouchella lehensis]
MDNIVLQLKDLQTTFQSGRKSVPAVDGVSIQLHKGEVVGIVGESGCGKSVTSLSIMRLIPSPPGKISRGEILFNGENLVTVSNKRMKKIRGKEISMIFQEPMTSLNPLFTIGNQLVEAIRNHNNLSKKEALEKAIQLVEMVGIPRAREIVESYPHQLSGGMRQRIMIAMAMSCDPEVLIADEPTTALDVTIQAQILDLMRELNREKGTAILFITHDLGVVADICNRVVVMYAGQVVEEGSTRMILKDPKHPYTQGLIRSLPNMAEKQQTLYSIPGTVPQPGSIENGCRFADRCEFAFDACFFEDPALLNLEEGRACRCLLYKEEQESVG